MISLTGNKPAMKKLFFLLPVLFFIKASAQEPYYDFKKFRENIIAWSDPNGTFVLPLDKRMSKDSLQAIIEMMQKLSEKQHMGTLVYTQPDGTRLYSLPRDNMPCLVPDMSQFNIPVMGKGMKKSGMSPGSAPPNSVIPEK